MSNSTQRIRVRDLKAWLADKDESAYVLLPWEECIQVALRSDFYLDEGGGGESDYLEFDGGSFTDRDKP